MATMRRRAKTKETEGVPRRRYKLSVDVHPAVKKALRLAVAGDDTNIKDKVHVILCNALDLPQLIDEGPNP